MICLRNIVQIRTAIRHNHLRIKGKIYLVVCSLDIWIDLK